MTSPIEPRTASLYHASRASAVEPWLAASIVMATVATYFAALLLVPEELALIVAQAALAVVPLAAVIAVQPTRPLAEAGLRGARPRYFVAALGVGMTAWYVNIRIASLLPLPEDQARMLEALVDRPSLGRALAMYALVPALCEEILFRGVLARSLALRWSLAPAAAISAVVFAAYHVSAVQALPTLTLGFMLALIAIRAGSVAPTMVAHAINNVLAITLSRGELPAVAGWLDRNPTMALAGCVAATGAGIAVAVRGPA